MKKGSWFLIFASIIIAVIGTFLLFTRQSASKKSSDSDLAHVSSKKYILKFGHDMPPNSAQHEAAQKFADIVNKKSNGQLIIEIYPSQTLGTDYDMINAAREGDIAIILTPTAKLSSLVPSFQYVDIPFLCPQKEDIYPLLDGESGKLLLKQLRPLGLIGVAFWESGFKQFTANKPILLPQDFKGLKMRTMKSRILMDQFKSLGAQAIPIDFHQTYKALQDKVVDGQENPLVSIVNMKFYEQQSHIIISNHGYLGYVCILSENFFNSLPVEYQNILIDTFRELTSFERQRTMEMEKEFLQTIIESKTHIHELTKNEREAFRKATQHLAEKYSSIIGYPVSYQTEKYLQEKYSSEWEDKIIIGLDADMTLGSAPSGHAIKRGMAMAIEEINQNGGLLGKKLHLVVRDNGGVSARGIANIKYFSQLKNLVAVMGGLHSPVTLSELDIIHNEKIIYLDPWAAATNIIDNGYHPNFVFRISVRDEYAGSFLVEYALQKYKHPALLLENTGWGRSNFQAISAALAQKKIKPAAIEWFNWGEKDMTAQLNTIQKNKADAVLMVANAPEGAIIVKNMASTPNPIPIISHWGITGGYFWKNASMDIDKVDIVFLQTFSYLPCKNKNACRLVEKYFDTYGLDDPKKIDAPAGVAHAYDLIHLLAIAIKRAGSIDRSTVRNSLETIPEYKGVLKQYSPPFTASRHDALNENDLIMAKYDEHGRIVHYKD